jgi:hypothetical protein
VKRKEGKINPDGMAISIEALAKMGEVDLFNHSVVVFYLEWQSPDFIRGDVS